MNVKQKLTKRELLTLTREFEKLIESSSEQEIHQFLAAHADAFLDVLHMAGLVRSKFRLAGEFIPDFMIVGFQPFSNNPGPFVTFIELESVAMPLFTKSGNPTSQLTHAIRQVNDWRHWMQRNRNHISTTLEREIREGAADVLAAHPRYSPSFSPAYGFNERYIIIAGRRSSMNLTSIVRLSQMNEHSHPVRIMSYDALWEELMAALRHY